MASHSFPGRLRDKLLAVAAVAALTILAGCGGSGAKGQVVAGNGYTFEAPSGWTVARTARKVSATQGRQIVQVSTFPLVRAYTPTLFDQVQPEIERVATQLKQQLHATLSGRVVSVAAERAWQYDLVHGDVFEQLTFVLREKREYQLYCRRGKGDSSAPCERLVLSFTPR